MQPSESSNRASVYRCSRAFQTLVTRPWQQQHSTQNHAATAGLARYKQPRVCLTIEKLPRSLQGKIQRARVRDMVLARYRMIDGPYPTFEEKAS